MVEFEFYKGLPVEYESFIIERYGSFMTTCGYIEIYFPDYEFNYSLVYKDSNLIELLMYGNKGNTCTFFNSLVSIEQEIIREFTNQLFIKYSLIKKILISASYVHHNIQKSYLISKSEDYIITLPSAIEDYTQKLGASMRKKIRKSNADLKRDFPDAKFVTLCDTNIKREVIDRIVHLNMVRMIHKGVIPGKNQADIEYIHKFALKYGCVIYIEINGEIAAGNISYVLNKRLFGYVTAHDNKYSSYNLGWLCRLKVLQTAIEKELLTYHLLWGNGDYKLKLLAQSHTLYTSVVYRDYSFDFMFGFLKASFLSSLLVLKQSEVVKPLRSAIKYFRIRFAVRNKYDTECF